MQHGDGAGGLSGVWAPVDGDAGAHTCQRDNRTPAERDPMQTDQPAGGAQKGRSRPDEETGGRSAVMWVAHTQQAEVLDVAAKGHMLAAALSNGGVHVRNITERSVLDVGAAGVASGPVTALAISSADDNSIIAVAADGVRVLRDVNSRDMTTYVDTKGSEVYSAAVSPDGRLLAVGGEGRMLLFDLETKQNVAIFEDTHKEAVSQVVWVPDQPATLISASDDGLVAVFDFAEQVDEDDSWRAAINLDGAVAKMGFYGASNAKLWMVSQLAGLHLWEWQAACSEDAPGGEGTLADIQDARGPLAAAAKLVADAKPSGPPQSYDYLLSCTDWSGTDRLLLAAGDSTGAVALFTVHEPSDSQTAGFDPPIAWLTGVHTQVVRALAWLEDPIGAIATGGEDGQLCVWMPGDEATVTHANWDAEPKQAKKRRKENSGS